jgi:hypothetical protein
MGPLRKVTGRFVERVNGGVVSDGAVVVDGVDLGIDELPLPFLDGFGPVPGEHVGILAPAGIRDGEEVDHADLLVLVPAAGSRAEEIQVESEAFYEGPAGAFLTGTEWRQGDGSASLSAQWWPKRYDEAAAPSSDSKTLVVLGEDGPGEVFGSADTGNDPFATGNNPFDTGNNPFLTGNNPFLLAAPGDVMLHVDDPFAPSELFDAGRPAPLGGVTFGMSVLSTPNASVAGQSANPLVGVETEALLQREEARRALEHAGVTDADEVEWLAGPTPVSDVPDGTEFVLLGEDARLESFTGAVSGEDGPWWVAVHVARATPDDHVVAAGVQRAPLGTGAAAAKQGDTTLLGRTLLPAREYMASTVDRLSYREGKDPE